MPLRDLVVLDLSRLFPGGYCTLLLADLGADVIKVEDLESGDYLRATPPLQDGSSALFAAFNRNKRAIGLDLKHADGRAAFLRLARRADVVVDGFRPGVLQRLGVGYDTLAAANARLVYCALTGYGQSGPLRQRAGHDLNYIGLSGILAQTGTADTLAIPGTQMADLGGGLGAAFGILAALWARQRTGHGQAIDVSMLDLSVSWGVLEAVRWLAGIPPAPPGRAPLTGGVPCYRVYAAKDGHITVAALEPQFWNALCTALGRPEFQPLQFAQGAEGARAQSALASIFATKTRAEWSTALAGIDACVEPVLQVDEVFAHPQVKARRLRADPGMAFPFPLSATPATIRRPAPGRGQHTDEVLAAAGYSAEELARLRAVGAIG